MRFRTALFLASALAALSAFPLERVGKVELVSVDLSKRAAAVAWTWTELADCSVRLMVSRNGDDFPTAGWGGIMFIGDGSLGGAVYGVTNGYNELVFDVLRGSVPTNGKYAVQILATNDTGRIEEWARGSLTVRANPSADGMPADWSAYADLARKVAPFIDAEGILTAPENAEALWNAVSNKTYDLIQVVSPTPDFTTNNETLVGTITASAPPPDLSGVVHGDDREADKAFMGLKFRASDDDGGNLRLRVGDPSGVGLRWYSDSTGTSLGNPFFALTYFGITHPTAEGAEDTTLTTWDDFTRARKVRDVMPDRSDTANRKYPISGGAFLDYFWGLNSLPTGAVQKLAGQITPNAASNLVRSSGALIGADGIMEGAAMLTATSAVPFYSFSPWQTDWPDDDPAQPTQPVWTNDAWAVWVVDGSWKDGPFTVQGSEADTNLNYSLYGYETRFWRVKSYGGTTNIYGLARLSDVPLIVTNEAAVSYTYGEWNCEWHVSANEFEYMAWSNGVWYLHYSYDYEGQHYDDDVYTANGAEDATTVRFQGVATLTREKIPVMRNALGLARMSDVAPAISNTVTKSYVEALGIESGIQEEEDPVWAAEKSNYATASALETVRTEASASFALFQGSNVLMTVTNYNSAVNPPRLSLRQIGESNQYITVWEENTGLTNTLAKAKKHTDDATNHLRTVYAPRAWSKTTSGLGADAPADTTWISTPVTVFAGGLEYAKVLTTYGEVFVLCGNGMVEFNPNTNAYFTISTEDGDELFSIQKTDAQLVPVNSSGITVDGNVITIPINVLSATAPLLSVCTNLATRVWYSEEGGGTIPASIATSAWTQTAGGWVNTITMTAPMPTSAFFKYSYFVEGATIIKSKAQQSFEGGITINGTRYRIVPYTTGGKTYMTVEAW